MRADVSQIDGKMVTNPLFILKKRQKFGVNEHGRRRKTGSASLGFGENEGVLSKNTSLKRVKNGYKDENSTSYKRKKIM